MRRSGRPPPPALPRLEPDELRNPSTSGPAVTCRYFSPENGPPKINYLRKTGCLRASCAFRRPISQVFSRQPPITQRPFWICPIRNWHLSHFGHDQTGRHFLADGRVAPWVSLSQPREERADMPPKRQLLDMKEVCEFLGVSDQTIRRAMQNGLPSRLLGSRRRFTQEDIEAYWKLNEPLRPMPQRAA